MLQCTAVQSRSGMIAQRASFKAAAVKRHRFTGKRGLCVKAASGQPGPVESIVNSLTVALTNSPINKFKQQFAAMQAGSYDVDAVSGKIRNYIDTNKVVVFSWTKCPFCVRAKQLLDDVGAKYVAVELDTMGAEGKAIRAELAKITNRTSVPQIFIAGNSVGGCNDGPGVITLHNKGELVPMLKSAGAA